MKRIRLIISAVVSAAAIPGQMCEVSGTIQLHDGTARLSNSGLGPLFVQLITVTHGLLARGLPVAALQILCSNQFGTAAGRAGARLLRQPVRDRRGQAHSP